LKNNIVAIMYDFDKTLCAKNMQEYTFIPNLNIEPSEFWKEADNLRIEQKMDQVLTYMYLMQKKMNDVNKPLKKEYLNKLGKDILLYDGVEEWFERINKYGKEHGLIIEHYIISSGLKEIIEETKIGKYFKNIYASEYLYNEKSEAVWPKIAINYTNKTQFLIRINKGILDTSDDYNINKRMDSINKRIPTTNMIYIGDGITDVPCMKLTKERGGVSIAVYNNKSIKTAKSLYDDERINYYVKADYRENSQIDQIVKKTILAMSISNELKNFSFKENIK